MTSRFIPRRDIVATTLGLTIWLWLVGPLLDASLDASQVRVVVAVSVVAPAVLGVVVWVRWLR